MWADSLLEHHLVKYRAHPATGVRAPIKGLFEPGCPLSAASTIQARLHVLAGRVTMRAAHRAALRLGPCG